MREAKEKERRTQAGRSQRRLKDISTSTMASSSRVSTPGLQEPSQVTQGDTRTISIVDLQKALFGNGQLMQPPGQLQGARTQGEVTPATESTTAHQRKMEVAQQQLLSLAIKKVKSSKAASTSKSQQPQPVQKTRSQGGPQQRKVAANKAAKMAVLKRNQVSIATPSRSGQTAVLKVSSQVKGAVSHHPVSVPLANQVKGAVSHQSGCVPQASQVKGAVSQQPVNLSKANQVKGPVAAKEVKAPAQNQQEEGEKVKQQEGGDSKQTTGVWKEKALALKKKREEVVS